MKDRASFLMQTMPLILTILVLFLSASAAHAGATSCGPEQSSGSTYFPPTYPSSGPPCGSIAATVFAYVNCTDQFGHACTISWNENYLVGYTFVGSTNPAPYCSATSSAWTGNSNIVDTCQ